MAPALAALSIVLLLLLVALILGGFFSLLLITLVLFSIAFGIKALLSAISFVRLNRDLRDGQKRFIDAQVETQDIVVPSGGGDSSAYTFWIRAAGRKIVVTEDQYYKVKKGDTIQAYVAPYSGTVLGLSTTGELTAGPGATPVPYLPPAVPVSKRTRKILVAAIVGVVVVVVVLAVAGIVVMNMSEKTYNSINPFAPKPPQGAFPATIGNYKQNAMYYSDNRRYGSGYDFYSYYQSTDGKTIEYHVIDYGSAQNVKDKMRGRNDYGGKARVVQQSDSRVAVAIDANATMVLLAAGQRLIRLQGKPASIAEFENALPYAALEIERPAPYKAADLGDKAIPAASMLEEFVKVKNAAAAKYDGKTILFSGTIATVPYRITQAAILPLQKASTSQSKLLVINAYFPLSYAEKIEQLSVGQQVNLRCNVNVDKETKEFARIGDCQLE